LAACDQSNKRADVTDVDSGGSSKEKASQFNLPLVLCGKPQLSPTIMLRKPDGDFSSYLEELFL
jgi:hypothetical protein